MEEKNTITLSSSAFSSRLLRSVSEVQDDCCVREPKYFANVAGCFHTRGKSNKCCFSFRGCYSGLQNKKTILTIQTIKYFEQIGHFTFVQSTKIPHVQRPFQVKLASNVMCRPLTISTELKLAAHFGWDLDAIKSYFWPIVQVKHVNKVFPPFPIAAKPVWLVDFLRG